MKIGGILERAAALISQHQAQEVNMAIFLARWECGGLYPDLRPAQMDTPKEGRTILTFGRATIPDPALMWFKLFGNAQS